MATGLRKDSRYRALRGKSVSEHQKDFERIFGSDNVDSSTITPPRGSTTTGRKRSKVQGYMERAAASTDDLHSPLLSVPPVPHPQKEHTNTTRPKAAVIPPRPEFGRPSSPSPVGQQNSAQEVATSTAASVVDDVAFSDKIATNGDEDQTQELQNVPEPVVEPECDEQPRGLECAEQPRQPECDEQPREVCDEQPREEEAHELHQHDRRDPSPLSRSEAETDRMLAEQKRLLHQQLMSTELASESTHSLTTTSTFTFSTRTSPKTPILGRLGFFSRGRSSRATFSPASSTIASMDSDRTQSTEPLLSSGAYMAFNQQLLTPPLSPVFPSNDTRASQVCVRYRGEWANIPISDTTDTVDVLCRASKMMNSPINTSTSIVLECYASLGLERRLRRYERVGDVTGSWSRNTRNSLLIRHAQSPQSDKDLDFASVPETPPGFMLQLYHCSRPGKWQQRWITLLQDGQMVSSKKPASSFLEKDCQRLCHMAVCDIYVATNEDATSLDHRQSRGYRSSPIKGLKPPKKHVLAVKAQNKPITKHEADNYVHFFCTESPDVSSRFHDMVHAWRSWYMVKVKRQSQSQSQSIPSLAPRETEPAPQITSVKHTPTKSVSYLKVTSGHKVRISRDDTPYTIGEIGDSPLIDMQRFDKPLEEYGKDWIKIQRHSGGSPMTPGTTDSGVSMTAPSTGEFEGNEIFDCGSPSEERRKRLDMKRSFGPSGTVVTTEGSSDVPISITEPPAERSLTPPPPEPKPEVSPWLPSASEHTAKLKAEQACLAPPPPAAPPRPVTSSGLSGRNSLQPPTDIRRRRPNHRNHPSLPPQQVALWREAAKWADSRVPQNLEPSSSPSVPSAGQRLMAQRPSMPSLINSSAAAAAAANKRGGGSGGGATPANYPPIWREPPTARPSTSSGERASRLARGRSTSGSSVRRGQGGEMPPPMPNMPAHWRQGPRDVNARATAGLSAPNLLNGGRGWVAR